MMMAVRLSFVLLCLAMALQGVVVVCAEESRTALASRYNTDALALAGKGDLVGARSLFEKAVKADPTNSQYANNVGVVHLRLNSFPAARSAFLRALELDPTNVDAAENLKELRSYQGRQTEGTSKQNSSKPSGKKSSPKKKRGSAKKSNGAVRKSDHIPALDQFSQDLLPKNTLPIPRVAFSELYLPENRQFAHGLKPFILTGAIDDWPAMKKWDNAFLAREFSQAITDFYPHNMGEVDTHPYLTPMHQALRELENPSGQFPRDKNHPGSYIQWNVAYEDWARLRADMRLPFAFERDPEWLEGCLPTPEIRQEYSHKVHWRMLLIGSKGAGMFIHQDVLRTASWQAQLKGSKRWFVCAPDQSFFLYGAGKVDAWDPDYEAYPNFADASCFYGEVMSGEMVYYPLDYWHQTMNTATPTVTISASILDANNYREIREELRAECQVQKYNWNFSKELCSALEDTCFPWWDRVYGSVGREHKGETCDV